MSKPDFAKLNSKLKELRERYNLLRRWRYMTKEEFLEDPKNNRAVLRVIQEAIESTIGIATHIVATQEYGRPETYAEAFKLLAEHEVIDQDFESELEKMVGFRNRIIHRYWDIDLEEVYRIFSNRIEDFKHFEKEILTWIEKLPED